ncbi:Lactonohydrolase oryL-like protein [Cladobotryum mycophilum]|uniref:Lactonohydrolase oryL-like protein n=1 Tax=Cladobotryum mycophilum TaxID=491253 RepID=A0ABR0SN11_9HYPO
MPPQSNSGWRYSSLVTVGVAIYAIGVTTSDAVQNVLSHVSNIVGSIGEPTMLVQTELPLQAQIIDPSIFAVLPEVPPPDVANGTTIFIPPGSSIESLFERPFHIYHPDFLDIIGSNPTLTLIAQDDTNPLFHEAVVWYPPTDEVFFVQNAGAPDAGTGLNVSSIIQKISMKEAMAVSHERNAVGKVTVEKVTSKPTVINPNGGTNYKGNILFTGEGMGAHIAPALYAMNPVPPHNSTILLNNYFGRQFNSLNDVAVNPRNQHIYFTDVTYGFHQDFRPTPGLPNQVYRFDPHTKAVTAVADDVSMCNGVTFSPDGRYAYVTDTGANKAFYGYTNAGPASIYRYEVSSKGTFQHRQLFAYIGAGVPDGIHCDAKGNVYSGCGDGIHVWNPAGTLLGKIFVGDVAANFQFAGNGRMIICAETHLYFATLAAKGAPIL